MKIYQHNIETNYLEVIDQLLIQLNIADKSPIDILYMMATDFLNFTSNYTTAARILSKMSLIVSNNTSFYNDMENIKLHRCPRSTLFFKLQHDFFKEHKKLAILFTSNISDIDFNYWEKDKEETLSGLRKKIK